MTPVVRALLIANVAMFFLQEMMPLLANLMVFVPRLVLQRPYSVMTYMFLHGGLTHLLFNMLALFFFGPRVESRIGSRRFVYLYFIAGLTGAAASAVFSPASGLIGASAGVFGVSMAFAYFWPHAPILIWGIVPVPARMLVIITTIISLWSGIGGMARGIGHFAHLGGYLGGYLYLLWMGRARTEFRRKVEASTPEAARRVEGWRAIDRTKIHEVNRDEVDRLLDKISAHGINSLTPQEQLFLSNFVPPDDRVPPS